MKMTNRKIAHENKIRTLEITRRNLAAATTTTKK